MMVKPGRSEKFADPLANLDEIKRLVKAAVEGIQPPSLVLLECEATRKRPKQHPRQKVARKKPGSKAKPAKAKISAKKPTIPVAVDEQRYALWWDFKKDRTFMSVPYPIQPKDRAEGIQKTLNSQRQRAAQQRLRACGTTPRCDKPDPNKVGSVCHEASPEFKAVVDSNMDYVRELSARTCVDVSIASAILSLRDRQGRQPIPAAFNSTLVTVERSMALIDDAKCLAIAEYLSVEREIEALEQQISIPAYPSRTERAEDKYWKEKLEELGLAVEIPSVSASIAANDSVFDAIESQYEKDQWMSPKERLELMREAIKHEPWADNSEVQYYLTLKKFDDLWYSKEQILPVAIREVCEIDGIEYGEFLRTRCTKQGREVVEAARLHVDPDYIQDLGTCVHPLQQSNMAAFHNMSLQQESRRIAMFDYGVLDNAPFEQLSRKWKHTQSLVPLIDYETIEFLVNQRNKEALAEKIISQRLNQMPFQLWSQKMDEKWLIPVLRDVVEDTTQEKLPTIDSEVDPISEDKETEVVSNVIDILFAKTKRTEGVQELLDGLNFNFADYSAAEKEGARKFIVALYEALG